MYEEVVYHGKKQKRTIALRSPNLDDFSPNEVALVYETIHDFLDKNATEISEESHLFVGWRVAKEREIIPYSTALVGNRLPTEAEKEYGRSLHPLAEEVLNAHR